MVQADLKSLYLTIKKLAISHLKHISNVVHTAQEINGNQYLSVMVGEIPQY